MSTLVEQLEHLHREASAALDSATTLSASEAWYSDYLGRKGKMTAILRGLGQLPQDERPVVGQTANQIKSELEAALKQRQSAIEQAEMEQALAAEGIDVTMPGRKPVIGGLHPTTTAMREIVDIFALMGFRGLRFA
jgi:phenylalanyl-tRNA synthetase alpha chain